MIPSEAKDSIVQEVMQQAALDGVSVSNLEKRMMYFTESSDALEDPVALNTEFEARYDSTVLEKEDINADAKILCPPETRKSPVVSCLG
jgi:hypothetical protein